MFGFGKKKPDTEDSRYPVYVDEGGQLYAYEAKTGRLWYLKPGDFAGDVGHPMPGVIKGKGSMTMVGMYNLED
jgi:hypothetical protein